MNVTVRGTTDGESVEYIISGVTYDNPLDGTTEHDIEISGGSQDNQQHYEIHVDGHLEAGDRANISNEDDVSENTATGYTVGGTDSYRFVGAITQFEVDSDATVRIDGAEVDPANVVAEPQPWEVRDETDSSRQHQLEGRVTDFTQVSGKSDWVLTIDGTPTAFGGPQSPVGGEFAYATRAQVQSFVECSMDELRIELEDYVRREDLEAALQSAFENASVSITTSGITLNPPEQ